MKSDERDELDGILDHALSSYAEAEPPPGMAERVLQRVRARRGSSRFAPWRWAVAAPARLPGVVSAPPASLPGAPKVRTAARRSRLTPRQLPKREQFPTPVPLTSQERALMVLLSRSPELARQLLSPEENRSVEPILIEERNAYD